jgi:hypothetical protein
VAIARSLEGEEPIGNGSSASPYQEAVSGGFQIENQRSWFLGRDLSIRGHSCLQEFMAPYSWYHLSWLVVATSGESLTGVRIGVVTARTIGQQCAVPVYGIPETAEIPLLLTRGYERWLQGDRGDWDRVLPQS